MSTLEASDLISREYIGDGDNHYAPISADAWMEPEPYIPSARLVEAVNLALHLRRPLLLEGEPGCGKTRLAYAVAYELGYPLRAAYVRSTSRAQDLLYMFDAVERLYDIQEHTALRMNPQKETIQTDQKPPVSRLEERQKYVTLGILGEAIKMSMKRTPSVVLIDEIDKADIDFPNDLLLAIDRLQFQVHEAPDMVFDAYQDLTDDIDAAADHRITSELRKARRPFLPLVIITSNREKELPAAFLRRCLFFYIDFPEERELSSIVNTHVGTTDTATFSAAIRKFWQLRHQKAFTWRKLPSTSELLDWIDALSRDAERGVRQAYEVEKLPLNELPHLEVLVKVQSDRDAVMKLRPETEMATLDGSSASTSIAT